MVLVVGFCVNYPELTIQNIPLAIYEGYSICFEPWIQVQGN